MTPRESASRRPAKAKNVIQTSHDATSNGPAQRLRFDRVRKFVSNSESTNSPGSCPRRPRRDVAWLSRADRGRPLPATFVVHRSINEPYTRRAKCTQRTRRTVFYARVHQSRTVRDADSRIPVFTYSCIRVFPYSCVASVPRGARRGRTPRRLNVVLVAVMRFQQHPQGNRYSSGEPFCYPPGSIRY